MVTSFSAERYNTISFIEGRPGRKFLSLFSKRHRENIKFGRASTEEEARWKATNAEDLTTHFAELERLIRVCNLDSSRIANLDESGMTPSKDCAQSNRRKSYSARGQKSLQRSPEFRNVKRITVMPVIFANGDVGRPLFVVEGKSLKYRTVELNGAPVIETVADCLPRGSVITTREDVAGVDSKNFLGWAKYFADDVKDLTVNDRKVLLILDGYRSHMGYWVLHTLKQAGIVVYALPAHTSGTTQPLDVGVFGPFKEHIRSCVEQLSSPTEWKNHDVFDYLRIMREAYGKAFTRAHVTSAFRKSSIWPLNAGALIDVPRPQCSISNTSLVTVSEMKEMLEKKRLVYKDSLGVQPRVLQCGYVDTSARLTLTTDVAMELARCKDAMGRTRRAARQKKEADVAQRAAEAVERTRAQRLTLQEKALAFRVHPYKDASIYPRALLVRRQIAKKRTSARRAAIFKETAPEVAPSRNSN